MRIESNRLKHIPPAMAAFAELNVACQQFSMVMDILKYDPREIAHFAGKS
jgi:hypothetical protein